MKIRNILSALLVLFAVCQSAKAEIVPIPGITIEEINFLASDYDNLDPAIMTGSVAAQVGSYLTQLNTYDQAFANMDIIMSMPKKEREALKEYSRKSAEEKQSIITHTPAQIPEQSKGVWFRPFATFESVPLNGGPKVDNITYGGLVGADSSFIKLPFDIDMVWGAYAGYNGSRQKYSGNDIYENGGTLGLNASFYWKNFFTGMTANIGATGANATTMYGKENFAMLNLGIAGKTGYNWELADGKFIIQPNVLMSTTMVNTFDYQTASGLDVHSTSPLVAGQIAPGIKFIGNFANGWQPYASVQMMWNLMDKTYFTVQDIHITETRVDPYIQYGVGFQKRCGNKFTGYGQVMMRNGGRNGVALQGGLRYALGKSPVKQASKISQINESRNINISALSK